VHISPSFLTYWPSRDRRWGKIREEENGVDTSLPSRPGTFTDLKAIYLEADLQQKAGTLSGSCNFGCTMRPR